MLAAADISAVAVAIMPVMAVANMKAADAANL
jgi:hypothetical protein